MIADPTIALAAALVQRPSVTPDDAGCQAMMIDRLQAIGFSVTHLPFGEVSNFWAIHGDSGPILAFAGHTDVVPTGPAGQWQEPPFAGTVHNGMLHGRGAADMKGSLAAMITACERFVTEHPGHSGRIALLITSDEEGPARDGTVRVIEYLNARKVHIDWCVVGEPSSSSRLGDVIKNGRRGSLNAEMRVIGQQGHVAYPQLADNPIHRLSPALLELVTTEWDRGNAHFPATTFQVSNIHSGTGATNVIPGEVEVVFNFRFSTEQRAEDLQQRVAAIVEQHQLDVDITWNLSGEPFLTADGDLLTATCEAITAICGYPTRPSTDGGTSDGRFIAPGGTQVIELGPCNATIHKVDECVATADLVQLSLIYEDIATRLLPDT